ncbi:MAG TPA: MbtH family NRPS accessory protein [Pyrinomonadaceae bacterium]|jgi:MbtH protein|nr:MbtH family NRPS accessory protein [Pyrinomonadaceae bacterium]
MNTDEREDTKIYKVVLNHEEQYSIWPADRENPLGWFDEGTSGLKAECLARIKEVWTDMRPLSLRKRMEEAKRNEEAKKIETAAEGNGKAAEADGNGKVVEAEGNGKTAAADKPGKSKESKSRKKSADATAAPKRKRAAATKAEGTAA